MNPLPLIERHFSLFGAVGLFVVTFLVYHFTGEGRATAYDYFVPLADGFLHGRISIVNPSPALLEELISGPSGALYVIYPPMPAIVLLPQVAIWGLDANQTLASVFWGSLNTVLVFLLMRHLTHSRSLRLWIALLFAFGTIHWWHASIGSAWYFAHVISFLFLTLAIYATLANQRPFLIGLLLGASYWARIPTIVALPFFVVMLANRAYRKSSDQSIIRRIKFTPLLELGAGIGIFVSANFLYNYLRFGTVRDRAYSIQAQREPQWYPEGLFDISYIPDHLWIFFLKPPILADQPPYVMPSMVGLSILFTTPAFIYCLRAGINRVALACWSAVIPIALVDFSHGGVGWVQFGYRFGMDFYPFLLVLAALGMRASLGRDAKPTRKQRLLVLISILVNVWGVLWINKFGWERDMILEPGWKRDVIFQP
jgi:hypothetical protein